MDYFEMIAAASATNTGNWIKDGKYVLCIKEIKYEKKYGGMTWIVELLVLWAEAVPGVFEFGGKACAPDVRDAILVQPSAVGTKVSFTRVTDSSKVPNGPGDVKQFMLALTNAREDEFNRAEAAAKIAVPPATLGNPPPGTPDRTLVYEIGGQQCAANAKGSTAWQWYANEGRWHQQSPFARSCSFIVDGREQVARGLVIGCTTNRKINKGQINEANKGNILVLPGWQHIPMVQADIVERRRLLDAGQPIPWPPSTAA